MAGIEKTPLRIPDVWSPTWFRTWVVNHLAKADVRNAIGVGVEITSEGDSVATISTDADANSALEAHNADPFTNPAAFNAHKAESNPHPQYALELPLRSVYVTRSESNPTALLGYGTWVAVDGGPDWAHAWERIA